MHLCAALSPLAAREVSIMIANFFIMLAPPLIVCSLLSAGAARAQDNGLIAIALDLRVLNYSTHTIMPLCADNKQVPATGGVGSKRVALAHTSSHRSYADKSGPNIKTYLHEHTHVHTAKRNFENCFLLSYGNSQRLKT